MESKFRLKKNEDFQRVFRRGISVANRQLVLYAYPHARTDSFRAGISISKKIGNAVVRNRLKRQLKEAIRANKQQIASGFDLVLIVRKPALDLDFAGLCSSFSHVLRRADLHKRKKEQPLAKKSRKND
ncbi:ribonuclease P protein component [Bacillus horti]|uniref:Ribonuclease P protein component n=1 Tax=Caldalkalibacillus horti TaxID=77523 RepID=A0ABT9W1W5_9BACI|nr:ribonuclease P protein component [Bacillus horti]MDQ0167105.1 ribonuclease P protein component [Bacillus horti]